MNGYGFQATEKVLDGVRIITIEGELDIATSPQVRELLDGAAKDVERPLVVDLTECEFIDSSGVRAVLLSREAQNSDDGTEHLAVAAASEQILRILSVMGIDRVIPIRPTLEEATSAISG